MRVGVIISGKGSNLEALLQEAAKPSYPAEISLVIADRPCDGIGIAARYGVPNVEIVPHKDYETPGLFEEELTRLLEEHKIELVVFAGFMRIVHTNFVKHWRNRLINVHPSLLPSFKGLHTHERAIDYGVKYHGCTVHYVNEHLDDGPIVGQSTVRVLDDDTIETLAAKVLEKEHKLLPACVKKIASGKVRIVGHRVI